jgi:septal ring factor EnvC (AmiA/AmiB activator)
MVATLKTEQLDDDHKKEYCNKQFDLADDKKKGLERSIADLETDISENKEGIEATKADIKALEEGIKSLDKSVAEATEQRKEEHEDFTELMASDSAAKELLGFAKNRLNKFYNPKLYKAPTTPAPTDEDRAMSTVSFVQIKEHNIEAPPPPPAAPGAYKKKGEESTGVIAMIDLLVKDLDKEMTEAETAEKDAQKDYETMMSDSATKRAEDAKALTDKESTLAEMQTDLETDTETKAATGKELGATVQYISSLHAECDWLIQYFDVRKEARDSEIDALGKAKAVLSGADFSLMEVQSQSRKFLQ